MEIDQEYLEYVGQSSLALLAISAAYFVDLNNPISFGALLMIPFLYGYTTYISRERFRPATLLSMVTLIFTPLSTIIGFIAVFIPVSNILISIFASGTGFKNYSNATLLPMIFTGLIMGGIVFGAAQSQPSIKQDIVNNFEEVTEKQATIMVEQTQISDIREDAGRQIVETTSKNTIVLTRGYVLNNTDLDPADARDVNTAFQGARDDIPPQLGDMAAESSGRINISEQASTAASNLIEANLGIIILLMALSFYMLNPAISILSGISALAFEKLNGQL